MSLFWSGTIILSKTTIGLILISRKIMTTLKMHNYSDIIIIIAFFILPVSPTMILIYF